MRVALVSGAHDPESGVGRYARELAGALRAQGHQVSLVRPAVPLPRSLSRLARRLGWDVDAFFATYPIWARYPEADIIHMASQNLATLLLFRRPPGHVVVTVNDVIPTVTRRDPALRVARRGLETLFVQLAMRGLRRADALIADSEATAVDLRGHGPSPGDVGR